MRVNLPVTGREAPVGPDDRLISTTDEKGRILSANETFCRIAGFTEEELRGKAHNIVRHPDMPEAVYKNLWDTLKAGRPWMGIIKNRCNNGDHYWVSGYVAPVYENGRRVGYQSVRAQASEAQKARAEALYARMRAGRPPMPSWSWLSTRGRLVLASVVTAGTGLGLGAATPQMPLWGSGLVGAAVLAGAVSVTFVLTRRLVAVERHAETVFANPVGEYIYGSGHDMPARIGLALAMFEGQHRAMQTRMDDVGRTLSEAALAAETAADRSREALRQQRGETEQVATAMNEMSATVQEVSRNTAEAAEGAESALNQAGGGREVMERAAEAMGRLASEVEQAGTTVERLKGDTDAIRKVLDVIQGISEQTNLLALNAAIEAARAGEAGRGFAVVAEEVRALSARVSESTGEIAQMIERLESGAGEAVTVMGRSRDAAGAVADGAERARESMAEVEGATRGISDMNTRIATAAEEQSSTAEEINRNIIRVNDGFDSTDRAAEATRQTSHRLVEVTEELRGLIHQFSALGSPRE